MDNESVSMPLPLIPLRDIVVFPGMVAPLFVGREKSVKALETSMTNDKQILLVTQLEVDSDDPGLDDLNKIGTRGKILQLLRLPDGTVKVLIEGGERISIKDFNANKGYILSSYEVLKEDKIVESIEKKALLKTAKEQFESFAKVNKKISSEVINSISAIDNISQMADIIASHLNIDLGDKQKLLELNSAKIRLEKVLEYIENDLSVLNSEQILNQRKQKFLSIGREKGFGYDHKETDKLSVKSNLYLNFIRKIFQDKIFMFILGATIFLLLFLGIFIL